MGKKISKLDIAIELFTSNQLDKAEKSFLNLIKVKKFAMVSNLVLGIINFNKELFELAINYLETALVLDKNKVKGGYINFYLGEIYCYNKLFSENINEFYNKEKAENYYLKAINHEDYPLELIDKIVRYTDNNKLKISYLDDAIKKFKNQIGFYLKASSLSKTTGHLDNELNYLNLALNNGLESSSIYFTLGNIHCERKDFEKAVYFFKKCATINSVSSNIPLINNAIGTAFFRKKDFVNSRKYFELDLNDNNDKVLVNFLNLLQVSSAQFLYDDCIHLINSIPLSNDLFQYFDFEFGIFGLFDYNEIECFNCLDDFTLLLKVLRKIKSKVKDPDVIFKIDLILLLIFEEIEDFKSYILIFKSYSKLPIDFEYLWGKLAEKYYNIAYFDKLDEFFLGRFMEDIQKENLQISFPIKDVVCKIYKTKNYAKVVEICDKLSNQKIIDYQLLFEFAYSLNEINDKTRAKNAYETSLKTDPKSSAILNNLSIIYEKEGDCEKAFMLISKAIKYEPKEELYRNNLNRISQVLAKKRLEEKEKKIPLVWKSGIKNISIDNLDKVNYFVTLEKIRKVNKKYQSLIERDFKELIFNYLANNYKSTIVISGSFVEMILTYFCEKKNYKTISVLDNNGRIKNIKLYDAVLNDLISFIESKKLFGNDFQHLGNLSRVYRNYIHPGLELKRKVDIKTKSDLCFISAIEIFNKIIN